MGFQAVYIWKLEVVDKYEFQVFLSLSFSRKKLTATKLIWKTFWMASFKAKIKIHTIKPSALQKYVTTFLCGQI